MKAAITGGTGFIGKALTHELMKANHEVIILTRHPDKYTSTDRVRYVKWMSEGADPAADLEGIDAFINLAGESINSGRWTEERKKRILDSRMKATDEVLRIIRSLNKKPGVLINASAIGIYPPDLNRTYTEESADKGDDFLAETVKKWEQKASAAEMDGVRTVFTRFGIILGKDNGALPKIAMPYKMFAGGKVGSGEQWMSWIHIQDVASAVLFCMEHDQMRGPVNLTAPHPLRMNEFGKILGDVLNRPHWIPAPAFALKLALGEMSILVLEGQKVMPEKLQNNGYSFHFPELEKALTDIYKG
ncbi:TIGR01777 family oxidoreductase [Falsibacillus pallidus]|uniref:TIGR01777 family oxidoreductase n=1 Tax=Falsibacillus pallidus TaxID=493781 RepID=UPI003D990315